MWPSFVSQSEFVVVVGPQRSGTHLVSDCLAYDLGWHVLYETAFDLDDLDLMLRLVKPRTVVQAPFLLSHVNDLRDTTNCAVVVVRRNEHDIVRSQAKFHVPMSTGNFGVPMWTLTQKQDIGYGNDCRSLPACQYEWLSNQPQDRMTWVAYEDMKSHVLWRHERCNLFGSYSEAVENNFHKYLSGLGFTDLEIKSLSV